MKKTKLLLPLIGVAALVPMAMPLVSCNKGGEKEDWHDLNIEHHENIDIKTTKFKLNEDLVIHYEITREHFVIDANNSYIKVGTSEYKGSQLTFGDSTVTLSADKITDINITVEFYTNPGPEIEPLYFAVAEGEITSGKIGYKIQGSLPGIQIQCKKNDDVWLDWEPNSEVILESGDKLYVKNNTNNLSTASNSYFYFTTGTGSDAKVNVNGNIDSMINYSDLSHHCFYRLFDDCSNLAKAPDLPAMTLAEKCYQGMFHGCGSLTQAPILPATTLADYCYEGMFWNCDALTTMPSLSAETLAPHCYDGMFKDCGALEQTSALPATTLADYCYSNMFKDCVSLTQAPEILASTLAPYCCQYMFSGCTALNIAPGLPVTELAESCYSYMFFNCSALNVPPELKAGELANYCYWSMFEGCASLESVPELPATTLTDGCYNSMFKGCSSLKIKEQDVKTEDEGLIFTCPSTEGLSNPVNDMFNGCVCQDFDGTPRATYSYYWFESDDPLCFTADGVDSTIWYKVKGTRVLDSIDIVYKYEEDTDWREWNLQEGSTEEGEILNIENGQKLYVMNRANTLSMGVFEWFEFKMSGKIAASGNVNSMINYATINNGSFCRLFEDCASLIQAPRLPSTNLANKDLCYCEMFYGCTALTTAPALPATEIGNQSYAHMFHGCTSLTHVQEELPAQTLDSSCYLCMFEGCTSLEQTPKLPATTLAENCYNSMFQGCTSLTQAPELCVDALPTQCCVEMFCGCTSLSITESDVVLEDKPLVLDLREIEPGQNALGKMFMNCIQDFGGTPTTEHLYYLNNVPNVF